MKSKTKLSRRFQNQNSSIEDSYPNNADYEKEAYCLFDSWGEILHLTTHLNNAVADSDRCKAYHGYADDEHMMRWEKPHLLSQISIVEK